MPINAHCPGCGQTLSVGDEFAGAQGKCPSCGTLVTFSAAGGAPPAAPPPGAYPPAYSQPAPGAPGAYAPPAPVGPPRDNTELFTLIGIGGAAFSLLLLLLSTFLAWGLVSGIHFGDGRIVFCLSLLLGAMLGLSFKMREWLPLSVVVAGAVGTFLLLVMLSGLHAGGAGFWIGLFGAMGLAGTCVWTAVRFPLLVDAPVPAAQSAFIRTFGALLGTQTLALVLGVFYWMATAF
jgi:hypothetical protein